MPWIIGDNVNTNLCNLLSLCSPTTRQPLRCWQGKFELKLAYSSSKATWTQFMLWGSCIHCSRISIFNLLKCFNFFTCAAFKGTNVCFAWVSSCVQFLYMWVNIQMLVFLTWLRWVHQILIQSTVLDIKDTKIYTTWWWRHPEDNLIDMLNAVIEVCLGSNKRSPTQPETILDGGQFTAF